MELDIVDCARFGSPRGGKRAELEEGLAREDGGGSCDEADEVRGRPAMDFV
jgi:hypothetical protein